MVGEKLVLDVEKLASGGDGIAFSGGQVVFVPYSIPGEKINARVVLQGKGYLRAEILSVLEPAASRIRPPCPVFGSCGGCKLQHIDYPAQLTFKVASIKETFERIGGFVLDELPVESGSPYAYRNRIQLHETRDGGLGFMGEGSELAIRAPGCPITVPTLDQWLRKQNRKARPYKELRSRIGDRDRFVVFAQGEELFIEGETAKASARIGSLTYSFPLAHFFQSNLAMAERLVDRAVAGLSGGTALDLYSGAGLFAARLASSFDQVICVESDAVSLEAARGNVPPGKGRFHPQDGETWTGAQGKKAEGLGGTRFDWAFVDPPREGLSPKMRTWLKTALLGGLTYVSCDHATLARDLGELRGAGWRLDSLVLFDFYPQTGRIEALARLLPPYAVRSKEAV
ncbi:MAG: hypothetical protein NT061_09300 [Spirochaetes bacterium]|nr:hypothetical protein [Spirochaetota bacterium]